MAAVCLEDRLIAHLISLSGSGLLEHMMCSLLAGPGDCLVVGICHRQAGGCGLGALVTHEYMAGGAPIGCPVGHSWG